MVNHKRKVSPIDFFDCYHYFKRAIHENKLMKSLNNDELLQRAIQEFPKLNPDDPNNEAIASLQEWIDGFVDDEIWRKCYRFLNQKKYLANKKHKTIHITETAHNLLQEYAKNNDLTLSMAIIEALAIADFLDHSKKEEPKPTKPSPPSHDFSVHSKIGGNNIISLFQNDLPIPIHVEPEKKLAASLDWVDSFEFDFNPAQPKKPAQYDFKQNESYKLYCKRIKELTIKDIDSELLACFNNTFSCALTTENASQVGHHIINMTKQLIERGLFSTKFIPEKLAISTAIHLGKYKMDGFYSNDFVYFVAQTFGCCLSDITVGSRTICVFAGMQNHVQLAYKTFHHLNVFLMDEMENVLNKCHKNMKKKNKFSKARWHCEDLAFKLLEPVFEKNHACRFYNDEEAKKLSNHVVRNVSTYNDENEPIGGWRD